MSRTDATTATPSAAPHRRGSAPSRRQWPLRAALYAAVGALVGTLGDRGHTYFGVLSYRRPALFGEAWWVPLLMGAGGLALGASHALWQRWLGEAPGGGSRREVAAGVAWFGGLYLASGLFKAYPAALLVLFVATFVARALGPRPRVSRVAVAHALAAAVVGTAFEAAFGRLGAFRYHSPDALGVPLWLPGLYLHAALAARALDRRAAT